MIIIRVLRRDGTHGDGTRPHVPSPGRDGTGTEIARDAKGRGPKLKGRGTRPVPAGPPQNG